AALSGEFNFTYLSVGRATNYCFTVNLLSVSCGASFHWAAACYPQWLYNEPINSHPRDAFPSEYSSLIAWLVFGVLIGAIFFGWLAERIGRRACLLLMVIPAVLSWLIIIFSGKYYQLCLERLIAGSVSGCCFAVIPVYITEMTEDRHRSTLGTFMPVSMGIGMLLIHILGYFLNYETAAWIMLLIPLAFLCTFFFIPDTPEYLKRYHKRGVENSLRYFRGIATNDNAHLQVELNKLDKPFQTLENGNQSQRQDYNLRLSDFNNQKALKVFLIGLGLILAKQLSSCLHLANRNVFGITSYIQSSIIVIIIQLMGSFSATLLVERAGRKTLLLYSTAGICLGQVAMVFYYYTVKKIDYTSPSHWILIVSFSLIIFSSAIGITTVDFVVITEITPPKIRSLIVRVYIVIFTLTYIHLPNAFLDAEKLIGIPGAGLGSAVFAILLTIFIALYVPETKGKSIEAIQASL
ncbi:hypothetical protein KR044_005133, partial [Drosophila immigrans]